MGQLIEDSPNGPHINGCRVNLASQKHFRGPIPESNDLVSVGFQGQTHSTSQAKICDLNLVCGFVDQQVGRLKVAVHNSALVTIKGALEELVKDGFNRGSIHGRVPLVQILLHVLVKVLENKVQTVLVVSVHNLLQINYVWVVAQLLKNRDFSDGRRRNPVVAVVDLYLFDCNDFITGSFCLINDSVGALAQFLSILELVAEFFRRLWHLVVILFVAAAWDSLHGGRVSLCRLLQVQVVLLLYIRILVLVGEHLGPSEVVGWGGRQLTLNHGHVLVGCVYERDLCAVHLLILCGELGYFLR